VETFKEQILAGGPITVTHPEMMRYFMTIPEAVQLVLQAAALGRGGEIFMLDMGDPVRVLDLAHDIIELSGLAVGHDIDVVFTGIRPGEKLVEELHLEGEEYEATLHEKIRTVRQVADLLPERLDRAVTSLIAAAQSDNRRRIMAGLRLLVPEFLQKGPGTEELAPPLNGVHVKVSDPITADSNVTAHAHKSQEPQRPTGA
jgi:FlaA1/EpsC-like NDP-sugar epimerase